MDDSISRAVAIRTVKSLYKKCDTGNMQDYRDMMVEAFDVLPSAQPNYDEWCGDCKEYDQKRHSCPRWNRVIRQTVDDMKAAQPGWVAER